MNKKLILGALFILTYCTNSVAMSQIGTDVNTSDVIISDNPLLNGEKYNGKVVKWTNDFIGMNINYIKEVVIAIRPNGGGFVQINSLGTGKNQYQEYLKIKQNSVPSSLPQEFVIQETGVLIKDDGRFLYLEPQWPREMGKTIKYDPFKVTVTVQFEDNVDVSEWANYFGGEFSLVSTITSGGIVIKTYMP